MTTCKACAHLARKAPTTPPPSTGCGSGCAARFSLGEGAILVAEVACAVPGCPPIETVIAFWSDERRHHFKVFKPVAEVTEQDLPPYWMKRALAVSDDFQCECC